MNSSDGSKLSRAGKSETRELVHGAIGSARVTAFGVSNVAPSGAVVGGLVIVVGYAGLTAPAAPARSGISPEPPGFLWCLFTSLLTARPSARSAPNSAPNSGTGVTWSSRRRPPFSSCFRSFLAAGVLRAQRPARLETLGRVSCRPAITTSCPGTLDAARGPAESPLRG